MEAIVILSKKCDLKIHLVTFGKGENKEDECINLLLRNCQWLNQMTHCLPEYAVLKGGNKARSMLAYAKKINADVLIVNPTAEVKIGWLAGSIPDVLPRNSNLQILAVQ